MRVMELVRIGQLGLSRVLRRSWTVQVAGGRRLIWIG